MDFKKEDSTICCPQETHFSVKDAHRLKVKGWRKFYSVGSQKKSVTPILKQNRL